MRIAHLPLDLGPGGQGGDRVDHQQVNGAAADQHFSDLQGLLTGVGLADQQVIRLDAKVAGILDVKGMFGIDERGDAAFFLDFGNNMQGQGGFAGGFRAEYLNDPSLGNSADPEGQVEAQGPGGNGFNGRHLIVGAKAHDAPLAELFFNLAHGQFKRAITIFVGHFCLPWQSEIGYGITI